MLYGVMKINLDWPLIKFIFLNQEINYFEIDQRGLKIVFFCFSRKLVCRDFGKIALSFSEERWYL